jgi:hypothetical protein
MPVGHRAEAADLGDTPMMNGLEPGLEKMRNAGRGTSMGPRERHWFFKTNYLWRDLEALARLLDGSDGFLRLPVIVDRKPVDPSDPSSPEVIQLESAMRVQSDRQTGNQTRRVKPARSSSRTGTRIGRFPNLRQRSACPAVPRHR